MGTPTFRSTDKCKVVMPSLTEMAMAKIPISRILGASTVVRRRNSMHDQAVSPFRIEIPQRDLDDLRSRLERTRWSEELNGTTADYGVPFAHVRRLTNRWLDGYEWRIWEKRLNHYQQFETTIDGQRIHFLHVCSPHPRAFPLIMTHGWPGSIIEFLDVIEPLTNPTSHGGQASDAFHVVIPSMPGYGVSGPSHEGGWDNLRI